MEYFGLGLLAMLIVGTIYERISERQRSHEPSNNKRAGWYSERESREFAGGSWRDYYEPFGDPSEQEAVLIHRAAEIAEQRRSGRLLGPPVNVFWSGGGSAETRQEARWLESNGAQNGVFIRRK